MQEAKAYFQSLDPACGHQSSGSGGDRASLPPPLALAALSIKLYETYITRLLREREITAALDALQVLETRFGHDNRGFDKSAREGLDGTLDQGENDDVMVELFRKEGDEDEVRHDPKTDELQALIDHVPHHLHPHSPLKGSKVLG